MSPHDSFARPAISAGYVRGRSEADEGDPPPKRRKISNPSDRGDTNPIVKTLKPKTWRITSIPKAVTRDNLKRWLDNIPAQDCSAASNIIQISMAGHSRKYAHATVTFQRAPSVLENECSVEVGGLDGQVFSFDSQFLGMTSLYENPDEDPTVE